MGLVQNLHLLILNLVCLLGWLSSFVFAQSSISDSISGSLGGNFPTLGITCVANLAFLVASLIRGRLDLEIGARDILDILVSPKLKKIDGIRHGDGLITYTDQESQQVASTRVGIQKMKDIFNWLRNRLHIVPCVREEEGLQTVSTEQEGPQIVSTEEGDLQIASLETASLEEGSPQSLQTASLVRLRTSSGEEIHVESVAVVMLSNNLPNLSIREFMKSNAPIAGSILLRFFPLQGAIDTFGREEVPISLCQCNLCNCVVFWSVEEITCMLANSTVGTLKRFPNSLCLIPCKTCLTNDCHRRKRDEGHGEVQQRDEGHGERESESTLVSEILDDIGARSINAKEHICICIPILHSDKPDVWTELLVRSLRSKDAEGRGVRVTASEALEGYLSGRRGDSRKSVESEYNIVLFILPRLAEVLINLVVTFWFRVDGFSSSLVARRAIRNYLVDSKGSGFAANAFLSKAAVKSDFNNTKVFQVLTFRGDFLGIKTLSFIVGFVNLISSIGWAVLILDKADISPTPSLPRVSVIVAAIGIALCTDAVIVSIHHGIFNCCLLYFVLIPISIVIGIRPYVPGAILILVTVWPRLSWKKKMFLWVIAVEIVCVVFGIAVAVGIGSKFRGSKFNLGRWVYGALQMLVWMKWAGGSYILTTKISSEFFGISPHGWGVLVYSSAFFLNAVLAGVRCEVQPWPWRYVLKHNHKLSPQASLKP